MTTPFSNFFEEFPNVVIRDSIHTSWYPLLNEVFAENLETLTKLNEFLENCPGPINPARNDIWAFTRFGDPSRVKVVIMGQEPYYSPGLHHNVMGFSVYKSCRYIPKSLEKILKEVEEDIISNSRYAPKLKGYPPRHGCLEEWAKQGVVFLDTALTVRQGEVESHLGKGWEKIVGSIIKKLQNYSQSKALVFMLWGRYAKEMETFLNNSAKVLKAGHPSPKNEHDPFEGCRHFSQANDFLVAAGEEPIDWSLTR